MKVTKQVAVPAKTETVVDHYKCELCDATRRGYQEWPGGKDGGYSVNNTEVEMKTGCSYPEFGFTTTVILDICPKCFEEKLIPWFRSQGGEPRTEESDY